MLPWGHAALGYLFYSVYSRTRIGRPPVGLTVYAVALGTQFPDLVDKPLTWTIPLLPYGRSLAHSLFTTALVLAALWVVFRAPNQRRLTVAFGVGYGSHLVGDGIGPTLHGDALGLGYLLWPLTSVPDGGQRSFLSFFATLEPTPMLLAGVGLTGLTFILWLYDGMPGVRDLLGEWARTRQPPLPKKE
jgi:hypothetical protein